MKRWIPMIALLLVAAPTAAQEVTLTATSTADEDPSVQAGGSLGLGGDVTIHVSGVDCAADVPLPVNLTASVSAPAGQEVTAEPGPVPLTLPAGAYHSEANGTQAGPYSETASGSATLNPAAGVSQAYTVDVELTAVFDGASSMECMPMEIPGAQSDPITLTVNVTPDQAAEDEGSATDGAGDGPGSDTGGDQFSGDAAQANGSSAPPSSQGGGQGDNGVPIPWQLAPLALALVAVGLQRRDP